MDMAELLIGGWVVRVGWGGAGGVVREWRDQSAIDSVTSMFPRVALE